MGALPSVTTFSLLPRPSRAATRSVPASPGAGILKPLAWRWHRLRAASRAQRLRRAATRGQPIFAGTHERPYDPASPAPWEVLGAFSGLAIRVVTRSPEILGELPVLAELDRRHAVAVDLVIAGDGREAPWWEPVVRRLAAEGITTRVLLRLRSRGFPGEAGLRRLFTIARRAGTFDLQQSPHGALRLAGRETGDAGARRFQRLRLEFGFPHPQPGRG